MTDSIFLLRSNESDPVELREHRYDSEDHLQRLIANHPDVMAGDQIDPDSPRRWLLVEREQGVPDEKDASNRWSLDHLFLDQDAIPTLVEVKRSSDTRIRREVVGQMMDYAANAVIYWPVEEIRATFNARCISNGDSPDELIADLLDSSIEDDGVGDRFWQQVKTNLQAGRIRLVFAADTIPRELRRIIEFLNGQMDPAEVIGVELKQFKDEAGDFSILVPKVSGMTADAERKKRTTTSPGKTPITREEFFAAARQSCTAEGLRAVNAVVEWADRHSLKANMGRGARTTTFIPGVPTGNGVIYPFSLRAASQLCFQMKYMKLNPPFDDPIRREELRVRMSKISGWKMRDAGMTGFPIVDLNQVQSDDGRAQLVANLDWMLEQITASAGL